MKRLIAVPIALTVVLSGSSAVAQVSAAAETFKGIHWSEGLNGRPKTVTVTDGKSFIELTEEEYRAAGYLPAYERLPTKIIRRVPVRAPAPPDLD